MGFFSKPAWVLLLAATMLAGMVFGPSVFADGRGTAASSSAQPVFRQELPPLPVAAHRPHVLLRLADDAPVAALETLAELGLQLTPAGSRGIWYVSGPRGSLSRALEHAFVRGLALPPAAMKRASTLPDAREGDTGETAIRILFHPDAGEERARSVVARLAPLAPFQWDAAFASGSATVDVTVLDDLAAADEVFQIWPAPPPRQVENINSRDSVDVEKLESQRRWLDGTSVRLGIWDGGRPRLTHLDFGGRVTSQDGSPPISFHATHVAGTMVGSGDGSNTGGSLNLTRGMAPGAELWSYDYANDRPEINSAAPELDASNHSYGFITGWRYSYGGSGKWHWFAADSTASLDEAFGKYDPSARDFDQIVHDHGLPIFKSAGNDRNDSGVGDGVAHYHGTNSNAVKTDYHRPDGFEIGFDTLSYFSLAKNIISVGSVHDVRLDPVTAGGISMTAYSAWGPADDGRVKPDVVANGESVFSTGDLSDTDAFTLSGTSMASPAAAGVGALLLHRAALSPRAGVRLGAAEMKALLVHTAVDAGLVGPDYRHGWGLVNALGAVQQLESEFTGGALVRRGSLTTTDSVHSMSLATGAGSALKATLVWVDPPGTPNTGGDDDTAAALVNDLDLQVSSPTGVTRHPWTLNGQSPLSAALRTQANRVDNVEQVLVDSGDMEAGDWTLQVTVNGPLAAGRQDYFLVVSFPCAAGDGDCDGCAMESLMDEDNDGICADRDVCTQVYDPLQQDRDGNGAGDACDSADGLIQDVRFDAPEADMSWAVEAEAQAYHVYRSVLTSPVPGNAGSCYINDVPSAQVALTETPAVGEIWLLQVAGVFAGGEGSLGESRNGVPRQPVASCP